jgi:tryptophan synthase alpha chain
MPEKPRSIAQSFADLRSRGIGLVPFLPAGFPDLETTAASIKAIDAIKPAAIEIGFPFSDPIADGPIIQQAFTAALARKITVSDIFKTIRKTAPDISTPLVAMLSYSIVFRYGTERFFSEARSAGFAGLIIPDLPPPEAQKVCDQIRVAGLDTILLIAPTTNTQRRKEIAELCSGFVYYLSVSGITGTRDELPPDLATNVRQIKSLTDRPVCVGFGISKPHHVAGLRNIADGAVVGSAIVKRMIDSSSAGPSAIAKLIADFCRELLPDSR